MKKAEKWVRITENIIRDSLRPGDRVKVVISGDINMIAMTRTIGRVSNTPYPEPTDIKAVYKCIDEIRDRYSTKFIFSIKVYRLRP